MRHCANWISSETINNMLRAHTYSYTPAGIRFNSGAVEACGVSTGRSVRKSSPKGAGTIKGNKLMNEVFHSTEAAPSFANYNPYRGTPYDAPASYLANLHSHLMTGAPVFSTSDTAFSNNSQTSRGVVGLCVRAYDGRPTTPFLQKNNGLDVDRYIDDLSKFGAAATLAPCPFHNYSPRIFASNQSQYTIQNGAAKKDETESNRPIGALLRGATQRPLFKYYFQASPGAYIRHNIPSKRRKNSRGCFFIQPLLQVGLFIKNSFKFFHQSRNSSARPTGRPRVLVLNEASRLFKILHSSSCPFFYRKSALRHTIFSPARTQLTSNQGDQP